ncbi:SDR family NAD(P)-dependent oxidoreductase [Clostridium botulinum]|nr:SDR family NAD(P)-dependent oxidoreductase [Clostridium botulinum]
MMDLYEYIIEATTKNKLDKDVAINIIKKLKENEQVVIQKDDIAITGISLDFPMANDINKWWEILKNGTDCISSFPVNRKHDLEKYLDTTQNGESYKFYSGAYLNDIDRFDYSFFSISPKEASLMDPCQRIFLQNAWKAIEDSGYKPEELSGSKTGVYVGYSSDFGETYKTIVESLNLEESSIATVGNIHSIIASRISYILNLKGPSIMVDTACSSALTAIHFACKSIQNMECNSAIAGGIKINLIPLYKDISKRTGIESSTERTHTFDNSADGTGLGEGCGVVFLKPLKKALQDKDNIYAVIKGSAINQDGNSIGITAPNAESQKDLIVSAWKDADINSETISYIEAHGTGTKLGDPIEIEGITKAFKKFTDKKQFCAMGSVKTNIGHLDNASGIASLIKVIASLQNKMLPPSINFIRPNKNINFEDSPIYINDISRPWETDFIPRRCGISSFGLSGTNCHLIIEEALQNKVLSDNEENCSDKLFTVSAKCYESLKLILGKFSAFIKNNKEINISDICFTSNCKRKSYNTRLAIIAKNVEDLNQKIDKLLKNDIRTISEKKIYFNLGNYDLINRTKKLSLVEVKENDNLEDIAMLYVDGAELDWTNYYKKISCHMIHIPTYEFKKSRCWINCEDITHPLLIGDYSERHDIDTYTSVFDANSKWVVNEHKIDGKQAPPGTTYIEMFSEIGKRYFGKYFKIKDLIFITPMIFEKDEIRKVRTKVLKKDNTLNINIESRSHKENSWILHVTGKIETIEEKTQRILDIEKIKECYKEKIDYENETTGNFITLGHRWENIRAVYKKKNSILLHLSLDEIYYEEDFDYNIHPALLDMSVNFLIRQLGNTLYLPFSYESIKIYGKMPNSFYSILKNIDNIKLNMEAISYDITLVNEYGEVFADIKNYSIKRVNENIFKNTFSNDNLFFDTTWKKTQYELNEHKNKSKRVLLLYNEGNRIKEIIDTFKINECEVISAKISDKFEVINKFEYTIQNTEEDFTRLLRQAESDVIIHSLSLGKEIEICNINRLKYIVDEDILSLMYLSKALLNVSSLNSSLIVLSEKACRVLDREEINPINSALLGFGKVIIQECGNLKIKCIDINDETSNECLINEILNINKSRIIAIRDTDIYEEELININKRNKVNDFYEFRDGSTYIITGGTGGIGIEIAKYLSSKNKVNICLISRSGFTLREEWNDILKNSSDKRIKKNIKILKSIEEDGSNIEFFKADISVESDVKNLISNIKNKYGKLNGIFHAAGVAGDGFIINKHKDKFYSVLNPKILGTWLLDKYTRDDDLELFILFSSITSKTGSAGQSDYTAANSYLDAYSYYRNSIGKNTIVINWAPWSETGMAVDYGTLKYELVLNAITTDDALKKLDKIIRLGLKNVIVGELNKKYLNDNIEELPFRLENSIKRQIGIGILKDEEEINLEKKNKTKFNVILTGKDGVYSEIENLISNVIGNVTAMRKINVNENFKNMGIDSIIASIVVRNIDESIPNVVSIADFYTYSTVAQLAKYVENNTKKNNKGSINDRKEEKKLKGLLKALKSDDVSGDEVLRFLDKLRGEVNE